MFIEHHKESVIPLVSWNRAKKIRSALCVLMFLADVLIIFATSIATGYLYHLVVHFGPGNFNHFMTIGMLASALYAIQAVSARLYTLQRRPMVDVGKWIFTAWTISFSIIFALGFITKTTADFSRGWILLFYLVGMALLIAGRFLTARALDAAVARGMISVQRIVLLGTPEYIERFTRSHDSSANPFEILDIFYLYPERTNNEVIEETIASARILAPDAIYLAIPLSRGALISRCVEELAVLPLSVHLSLHGHAEPFPHA